MSKSNVEIDFFQMEKLRAAASNPLSPERAASTRMKPAGRIQSVVSRINPQLLKTVMAAGAATSSGNMIGAPWLSGELSPSSNPSSPTAAAPVAGGASSPSLPVFKPAATLSSNVRPVAGTAPLTIFYNGTVTVFDASCDKAEAIMRMAETAGIVGKPAERPTESLFDGNLQLDGDLPIARSKSLKRFLEKRNERLSSASPYYALSPSQPCQSRDETKVEPSTRGPTRRKDQGSRRYGRRNCTLEP